MAELYEAVNSIYCYPNSDILVNKLDIHDNNKLSVIERKLVLLKLYELRQNKQIGNFDIYHFDLYRIKSKSELLEFDFDSAFDNISIIEWPELAMDILPKYFVKNINIKIKKNYRVFEIN